MALADIFFLGIALYILYKLVFNFFVPVFKTTRQVRQQFRNMNEQMQEHGNVFQQEFSNQQYTNQQFSADPGGQPYAEASASRQTNSQRGQKPNTGGGSKNNASEDYIDFEEIK